MFFLRGWRKKVNFFLEVLVRLVKEFEGFFYFGVCIWFRVRGFVIRFGMI